MKPFSKFLVFQYFLFFAISSISAQPPNKGVRTLFPIYQNDKCGYIDNQGKVVIRPQFVVCQDFSEGLAQVYMGTRENLKQGFINPSGQYVVEPKYFTTMPYSEGLARVCEGDADSSGITMRGCGFIDKTGRLVIGLRFRAAEMFSDGLAKVEIRDRGEYCEYIDRTGRIVLSQDVGGYCQSFKDGLAPIKVDGKWGFMDKQGRITVEPKYDQAWEFAEGLAAVWKDAKAGYVNKSGNVTIPLKFKATFPFFEGLAKAVPVESEKYGFIDKEGKIIISARFSGLYGSQHFQEGLAAIFVGRRMGYIDKTGKVVIKPQFTGAMSFNGGLAEVEVGGDSTFRRGNLKGYINKKGVFVWKPSK